MLIQKLLVAAIVLFFAATALADKPYTTRVEGKAAVGKEAKIALVVSPGPKYHWNKEYPAKLTLANGTKLTLKQTSFSKTKGEIVPSGEKDGKVEITCTGKVAGKEVLKGQLKFSMCSAETCKLVKEEVQVEVTVE